jgi:hypothetical protein
LPIVSKDVMDLEVLQMTLSEKRERNATSSPLVLNREQRVIRPSQEPGSTDAESVHRDEVFPTVWPAVQSWSDKAPKGRLLIDCDQPTERRLGILFLSKNI